MRWLLDRTDVAVETSDILEIRRDDTGSVVVVAGLEEEGCNGMLAKSGDGIWVGGSGKAVTRGGKMSGTGGGLLDCLRDSDESWDTLGA